MANRMLTIKEFEAELRKSVHECNRKIQQPSEYALHAMEAQVYPRLLSDVKPSLAILQESNPKKDIQVSKDFTISGSVAK